MAREWYSNLEQNAYSKWHRQFDGLAGIDLDFFEVCPKCYEPLAVKETCFDKNQQFKATTLTKMVGDRLKIPAFLIFYTPLPNDTMKFRIKRVSEPMTEIYEVNQEEWLKYLYSLQEEHRRCCKYATQV